ncbi:MAG: hypothetical protein GX876_07805 [Bacteroidales bacterium]|nr:hypothetical protein [Bacteroidales bacterium]
MVHVSPDCNNTGWTYAAGYNWQDNSIMGFSHTHFSGVGMTSGGDIQVTASVAYNHCSRSCEQFPQIH